MGDSAIHLLVDESSAKPLGKNPGEVPSIHRAVLLDSGENGLASIKDCIERIEKAYVFESDPTTFGKLKFDSVILTHWDKDHAKGIEDLVYEAIDKQLRPGFDDLVAQARKDDAKDPFAGFKETDVSGIQIPYFKYADPAIANPFNTTTTPIDASKLLTTFYIPYINDIYTGAKVPENVRLAPKTRDYGDTSKVKDTRKWLCNYRTSYKLTNNTLGFSYLYKYRSGGGEAKRLFGVFDLCRLVGQYPEYLANEVFYGKSLTSNNWQNIQNPGQLIKLHGLTASNGPRMYIVAGDQVVIGNTALAKTATVASGAPGTTTSDGVTKSKAAFFRGPIVRIVDEHNPAVGTRIAGAREQKSEPQNTPSICCVILSSTVDDPSSIDATREGTSWRLWHYMAGDALWDVEGAVSNWLKQAPGSDPSTTFMKVSQYVNW